MFEWLFMVFCYIYVPLVNIYLEFVFFDIWPNPLQQTLGVLHEVAVVWDQIQQEREQREQREAARLRQNQIADVPKFKIAFIMVIILGTAFFFIYPDLFCSPSLSPAAQLVLGCKAI
jgi:hypothetical protein